MMNRLFKSKSSAALWLSMIMSALLPMLLGVSLAAYFPEWRWSNYPFHAMLESVGTLCALTIASLMISLINNGHLAKHYIFAACALMGMGLLDGFHSVLHAGVSFIWLHSVATLAGGILFAAIWIPEALLSETRQRLLLLVTIVVSLFIGIASVSLPELIPTMMVDGQFSTLAVGINIIGGLGFLVGTGYFIYSYLVAGTKPGSTVLSRENLVFANHCLLFGIAGLLFEISVLWDAGWWWWHILRFVAYLVVMVYFFSLMQMVQKQLRVSEAQLDILNMGLEQRVKDRTRELEIASMAKSDFLSRMSHEFRTPLNAILGFGQLLEIDEGKSLSKEQAGNVREIVHAGEHLLELVNEVLDLGRIESGQLDLNIVTVRVAPLLSNCVSLVMPLANARGISIDTKIDTSLEIVVDEMRFKQIMLNLISNAIKYNREYGSIKIFTTVIDSEWVKITVEDSGVGIDADSLEKIFRPFERLVSATEGIEGSGVGLALTRKLVDTMQGELGVESVPGKGSCFWVQLPMRVSDGSSSSRDI